MLYSENIKITATGIKFTDKNGHPLSISAAFSKGFRRMANWYFDLELMVVHFVSEHVIFSSIRHLVFTVCGVKIGAGTTIHMGVRFFDPRGVVVGNDSKVGFGTFLDGRAQLKIGSHVDIASEVMIYNSEHDLSSADFVARTEPVEIKDYVFVGPRVIIMPGVTVGRGAVVAGGAVVTADVPDFAVMGGVPAKVIGERKNHDPKYRLGRARLFQ